jgi:hypothetical protein
MDADQIEAAKESLLARLRADAELLRALETLQQGPADPAALIRLQMAMKESQCAADTPSKVLSKIEQSVSDLLKSQ